MSKLTICPVDGNPIVAVLFLAMITFRWREREGYIPIDEVSLSFSTQESAQKFADDNHSDFFGCRDTWAESTNVLVHPDYSSPENAAKAVYHAIDAYKDSLVSIDRFSAQLIDEGEGVKNFIKDVDDYLKEYFRRDAIRIELSTQNI